FESVAGELDAIRAVAVRLEDLRAGAHVLAMDVAHQVRLPEVQLVIATVDENTTRIEHGAHRTVEQVRPAVTYQFPEIRHSSFASRQVHPGGRSATLRRPKSGLSRRTLGGEVLGSGMVDDDRRSRLLRIELP